MELVFFSDRPEGWQRLCPAAPLADSYSLPPLPTVGMTKVRDFVAGFARGRKVLTK